MSALIREAHDVLSYLMLLKLRALQSGEAELVAACEAAEEALRSWLEARR